MGVIVDSTSYFGVPGPQIVPPAPESQVSALATYLRSAKTPRTVKIALNFATGFTGTYAGRGFGPRAIVHKIRSGSHFVDYGEWPFGSYRAAKSAFGNGFTAFVLAAYGSHRPPIVTTKDLLSTIQCACCTGSNARGLATSIDAYSFLLCNWSWGQQARNGGYPYGFGFPTAAPGATSIFKPMASAPSFHSGGVNVYSAFALKIGSQWYFCAQPGIRPDQYGAFILGVLGIAAPSLSQEVTANCGQSNKPTLTTSSKGAYVTLAQQRLNVWGKKLTVNGKYDAATQAAVLALQKAHDHETYGGKQVLETGHVGPGMWNLLCSSPIAAPTTPTTPTPPGKSLCSSSLVTSIQKTTGLTCTEQGILGLGIAAIVGVALLRRG